MRVLWTQLILSKTKIKRMRKEFSGLSSEFFILVS